MLVNSPSFSSSLLLHTFFKPFSVPMDVHQFAGDSILCQTSFFPYTPPIIPRAQSCRILVQHGNKEVVIHPLPLHDAGIYPYSVCTPRGLYRFCTRSAEEARSTQAESRHGQTDPLLVFPSIAPLTIQKDLEEDTGDGSAAGTVFGISLLVLERSRITETLPLAALGQHT